MLKKLFTSNPFSQGLENAGGMHNHLGLMEERALMQQSIRPPEVIAAPATSHLDHLKGMSNTEIIEQIHKEFYGKVDELLADAQIGTQPEIDNDNLQRATRMEALGFSNTKTVTSAVSDKQAVQQFEREEKQKQELRDTILYFKQKYPLYKFITEEGVKEICNKYGLIYGTADKFIGDIPEKNLKEIEDFKIKKEDKCAQITRQSEYYHYMSLGAPNSRNRRRATRVEEYGNSIELQSKYPTEVLFETDRRFSECSLEIAAPKSDFDMSEMVLEGTQLLSAPIEVPDPVVLQPVTRFGKKHYLIVTAWGEEASDPLVVNEINN